MSLLLRKELQIALCREEIAWHRERIELGLHGYLRQSDGQGIIECEIAEQTAPPWLRAVRTLEVALPSLVDKKMELNVTLSNQFVQYALVPWLDKLSDKEELSFAQHCFRDKYGDVADSWSVRVSPGTAGVATLAGAIDTGLLEGLRGVAGQLGLKVQSIQPSLMAVYNSCRASLKGRSAWLAFIEPGVLCLLLLQKGHFAWVRKVRIGDDWRDELATILEREAHLSEAQPETDEVLLWAPHLDDTDLPVAKRWNIQPLKPGRNLGQRLKFCGAHTLVVA